MVHHLKNNLIYKLNRKVLIYFLFFNIIAFVSSCAFFKKDNIVIIENSLTGQKIYFSDLENKYKKSKNFSKIWSKLYSNRYRSYHKFLNKSYTIVGHSIHLQNNFLIIKDKKGIYYKSKVSLNLEGNFILPSYLYLYGDLKDANKLIGQNIWLNYVYDSKVFFTYSLDNFRRFSIVKVIEVINFSNDSLHTPIWLKVINKQGSEAYLRYSKTKNNTGFEDHYFTDQPLSKKWSKSMIELILKGGVKIGMNEDQLRRSIGNPDIINNTSSRYGLSEQWLYKNNNSSNAFYQFEYGKLVYVDN